MINLRWVGGVLLVLGIFVSCKNPRIKEHKDWARFWAPYGIADSNACFILRDNNHESVHYCNLKRCGIRYSPASTFKIFNALAGLESGIAPDDEYLIRWDSIIRPNPAWNKDMNMREAFRVSSLPYFQELARRIGRDYMQHYLDTAQYGNKQIGDSIDRFWINNSLQISADEQLGFVKKLYFNELPFSERSQRIVRSMMLQEDAPNLKLYYKTGWSNQPDKQLFWVTGFAERIVPVKEHEASMNKSDHRIYPYFFTLNFQVPAGDTTHHWLQVRIDLVHQILKDYMPQ
jgi:beta-lactamase class D